ncbi:MAG TPA: J domain-containing protein [Candidatus Udaeobacter sp.]|nr:J domain-containing protein [Candidatus Udaeobacter sp.]
MTRARLRERVSRGRTVAVRGRDRLEIVWIEQAELRTSAARECTDMMARLEQARLYWHQFERQDKPAFVRWRAREFGALLSTAREVEDKIRDAQNLIHDVEMEMRRKIQDPYSAYRRVLFRRENPGFAENWETSSNGSQSTPHLSEFEQEALFQEWVQKFLGTNPAKMDDDAYSTSFEVFKSHMFVGPESTMGRSDLRPEGVRHAAVDEEPASATEPGMINPRVKEIYRRLVRRLHPDLRADGDATVSSLWHEVQEAYAVGDVAQMELLLALSDLSNVPRASTTLSQMRSVLSELTRSVRALELSLVEARREDWWNFARTGPSEDLRLRVERQLKHDLALRQQRLELLTGTIAGWAMGNAETLSWRLKSGIA